MLSEIHFVFIIENPQTKVAAIAAQAEASAKARRAILFIATVAHADQTDQARARQLV